MTVTPERALPGLNDLSSGVDQWIIESMQMVHWGGFHGHHHVDVNVNATLLTGASGTGKSTLLDAYIALMMDSNTPFNGASNDNTIGRARGADQRNPLSYVRGKYNTSRDPETGQTRDDVLRGNGSNTWSALAVTWINDDGTRFTGMRYYYAPASARRSTEIKYHMATFPGPFDLRQIEPFAAGNFHHGRMAARFPGIAFHESYTRFAAALHKKLAIGSHGDGALAMRLLARVQGGKQVTSVDTLYKDMVLERPRTYEVADKAVEHFETLEAAYETMRTAEQQIETLRPIPDTYAALRRAETEVDLIDTFRVTEPDDADTPLVLWAHTTEAALLAEEISDNRTAHGTAAETNRVARRTTAELETELSENQQAQRDNGGDALAMLDRDLSSLGVSLEERRGARAVFEDRVRIIGTTPETADAHAQMRQTANEWLGRFEERTAQVRERTVGIIEERSPLKAEQNTLLGERSYLRSRTDLIPQGLSEARDAIAAAVGVSPADLPFVAELIDLDPTHEKWREAAELVLGGFARTLLVDRSKGRDFRRRLNTLRLGQRIQFTLADLDRPGRALDEDTLPGRFIFKEASPYIGWLQTQLATRFDYECVEDADQFRDDARRQVTLTGQTKDGDRGAHGGHGARRILGFSNARRLEEVEDLLTDLGAKIAALTEEHTAAETELRNLSQVKEAHQYVVDTAWDRIDTASVEDRIAAKSAEKQRLLDNSDALTALKAREGEILGELDTSRTSATMSGASMAALDTEWEVLVDREDIVKDRLEVLSENRSLALSQDQQDRLDAEYEKAAVSRNQREFATVLRNVRNALRSQVEAARRDVHQHTTSLTSIFLAFQRQWPRPNLGTGVDSYIGYQEILDTLVTEGLADWKNTFKQKVIDWSGEDLLGLHRAYDDAVDEIEERLMPVNEILRTLPFGRDQERLKIVLSHHRGDDIKQFRADLRTLASNTTLLIADDDVEARFKQLQKFITRIRRSDSTAARDHLLDVRRHVHVEAVTLSPEDPDGNPTAVFNTLGNKSGGETQELIAFIVGAALRYQLGNADQGRPTYAPVFLDEGFVKADSQFAGRAVNAWLRLGFQLIIGAPLDKVSAIQPFMDQILMVTKNAKGHSLIDNVTPQPVTEAAATSR